MNPYAITSVIWKPTPRPAVTLMPNVPVEYQRDNTRACVNQGTMDPDWSAIVHVRVL